MLDNIFKIVLIVLIIAAAGVALRVIRDDLLELSIVGLLLSLAGLIICLAYRIVT